ncbi:zinc finger MYM-type protein 1-like [Daktulosphaira vitifoliae]|uniref:zinc finger MYM-type protein 1-like n=1 Tax=Daktulosphaira vitifoliae TaxID=58002 RepID=UPI0021AA364A|nr:zinc finger MYM-type protein 1-like [Daktulosphaira vitifoliae]
MIRVVNTQTGKSCMARALLDSGLMSNFMTKQLANSLQFYQEKTNLTIFGIDQNDCVAGSSSQVNIENNEQKLLLDNITIETKELQSSSNDVNENLQQLSKDLLLQGDTENKKVQDDEIDYDDPVFCLYCRLFSSNSTSSLASEEFFNWKQISERLKEHELSISHNIAQEKWLQLRMRLNLHTTIDNDIQRNVNIEKERWRNILKRIIACIEFLAEHNDAFRGTSSKLYTANNGKFLGLLQMIAKFDLIMADHLKRVYNNDIHDHYLGPRIQNELINIIATKIRDEIINRVRQKEIKAQLKLMNIDLNNCRGQAYDNGANMIGHHQGVQSRILSENPRAFFVPCTAHSLNLLLGDMALSVPAAMTFFGVIQRIYSIFAASTERWTILLKYVSDFTLKPMSDTRWESRVESVKPIRFQLCQVHDALIEISESTKDPKIKSESSSLANYEFCYDFILSVVIWYELLSAINKVSKSLQSKNMELSNAVQLLSGLKDFFYNFRNEGFESSKKIAQNLCEGLDIQAVFKQSRIKKKVRQFNYESKDARLNSAEQTFYDDYFLAVIDQAIVSINERFEQLSHHSEYFGFLYNIENLKTFDEETLRKHCMDLEILLKDGENNDINGIELFDELKIFCRILNKQMTSIECLNLIETTCGSFPNISIALRILLTLPITTASAERSFSKLKIIKNDLRTSMTQNRLSDLAIISIERDLCENLDYNDIIEKFAEIKARKIDFM